MSKVGNATFHCLRRTLIMRVDEVKFPTNNSGILATLISIILLSFLFAGFDFAQTEKEDVTPTIKVEYLGSVPRESSLTDLVLEHDKQTIGLKERWLDSKANLGGYLAVSENGKYMVVWTAPDQKSEGVVKATFIDSNGAGIWSADVGYVIYVSNNGRNITAADPLGDWIAFYDVRTSTEPITAAEVHGEYTFSYNGEYFISAGARLILRRADGTLIWEKDTGTPASKKVAISADGSHIVMASSRGPEPDITDVVGLEEEQQRPQIYPPELLEQKRIEKKERVKKKATPVEDTKPSEKAGAPKMEKRIYLSFLTGGGTLINQMSIRLRVAQNLAMSREGRYVALSCDSTLLFYQTETGSLLWRKVFPTVYWWMKFMAVSRNGDMVALGIRPNRGDRYSPPHLYLVSKDGSEIGNFQLESPPPRESPPPLHYVWGPMIAFTEDDRHILVATYRTKYLFKVTEGSR